MENDWLIDKLLKDSNFDVRSDGTIWSKAAGKWQQIGSSDYHRGYLRIRYYPTGAYLRVNRVVYRKYVGELLPNSTIHHKDDNKRNNHPSNLEQISNAQNLSMRHGNNLTREIVEEIRSRYSGAYGEQKRLAKEYGISVQALRNILWHKTWK